MPRYDDRYSSNDRHGGTRLYVGHLSSRTRERDLERLFSKYGRIRDLDMKRDYAFIEFSDPRDADDARYRLDRRDFDGSRITVEFARGTARGSREISSSRGLPPGAGRCFNCGLDGHWARDCSAGDWKNKCYRCGDRGHIERNCKNSPKKLKRDASYSRSPVRSRSRSPRRRRRSPSRSRSYSRGRGRSYSRSRSPVRKEKDRSPEVTRSRSPELTLDNSPPPKDGKRGLTPEEGSPMREKYSPKENGLIPRGNDDGGIGTNEKDRSPSPREDRSPRGGHSPRDDRSPSGGVSSRDDRSPVEGDYY